MTEAHRLTPRRRGPASRRGGRAGGRAVRAGRPAGSAGRRAGAVALRRAQHRLARVAALGALLQPAAGGLGWPPARARFAAHAAAVVIKRVVRRERPHHPAIAVNVGTPSRLSFPSAHATSTTAASILLARATGLPLPAYCWCRRWRCPAWCLACTTRATCSPAWRSGRPSRRRSVWWPTGSEEIDEHLE